MTHNAELPSRENYTKRRIYRRIAVKTVLFGFWIISMIVVIIQGELASVNNMLVYITIALAAVWLVSTIRDIRRLRK